MKRMALALTLMLFPGSVSAQDEEVCDARPRYIVVTVLESLQFVTGGRSQAGVVGPGPRAIDRCIGDGRMEFWRLEGLWADEHYERAKAAAAKTRIRQYPSPDSGVNLYVKETVQQICAALGDDCGDATKAEGDKPN